MEKYTNPLRYYIAKTQKDFKRARIAKLFSWQPLSELEDGCTAIIGMCSRMPYVLGANLRCLNRYKFDALKYVLITVDAEKGALADGFEANILQQYPDLNITFLYYSAKQAKVSSTISDPYIYSWMSWGTCLNNVRTKHVLIHDYDALVLSKAALERRYQDFVESQAVIQGIMWYKSNGFIEEDRLATTFEAFMDVEWVRSFPPIKGYNKVGKLKGRRVDYDTYLDIQANHTPPEKRTIMPMTAEELVHPSQMITQYMRFRNSPGKNQACFSIIMIPFFHLLSGQENAIVDATHALKQQSKTSVNLLGDGVRMNLIQLHTDTVDFILKLIVQTALKLDIAPFKALIDYGDVLYDVTNTPADKVWVGDFTAAQRAWLEQAQQA